MTPEECAEKVLEDYDISAVPALSFQQIFNKCNIRCDEYDYNDSKYSGSLQRYPDESIILINTDCKYLPRINFTKAHELGHLFLNHKGDKFECTTQDMKTSDSQHKPQEVEANRFAAEFLLPLERIELLIDDDIFDISTISEIANEYRVSLSVATIRIMPLLKGAWCAVWAEKGIVKWIAKSAMLHQDVIRENDKVKTESIACKCFTENYNPIKGEYITVPANAWIKNSDDITFVDELTANLKNYHATLSLLRFK